MCFRFYFLPSIICNILIHAHASGFSYPCLWTYLHAYNSLLETGVDVQITLNSGLGNSRATSSLYNWAPNPPLELTRAHSSCNCFSPSCCNCFKGCSIVSQTHSRFNFSSARLIGLQIDLRGRLCHWSTITYLNFYQTGRKGVAILYKHFFFLSLLRERAPNNGLFFYFLKHK